MTILVCGATGAQGGAVARTLKAAGHQVRALTRDPASAVAHGLLVRGIDVNRGDLEDRASLNAALSGVRAVFSVQLAPFADRNSERRQAANLIAACREAGVEQVVHASVSGAGWRSEPSDGSDGANYWDSKEDVERAMREAGFGALTILKPAFMMENFLRPKALRMFPDLAQGEIVVATGPDTRLPLIAAGDVGQAAAAAFAHPERFAGAEIELAGDRLTFTEIAEEIARVAGAPLQARTLPAADVEGRGQYRGWVDTQVWFDEVGYPARPEAMEAWGLTPTRFAEWALINRPALRAALGLAQDDA